MGKKLRQITAPLNKLFFLISFLSLSNAALSQAVTGTVTDAADKPMSSVTVLVKGTDRATLTDNEGKFSVRASGNDVLLFSYVGYLTQEVPINGRQSVSVSMAMNASNMENIVVTALGIKRQEKKSGLRYHHC